MNDFDFEFCRSSVKTTHRIIYGSAFEGRRATATRYIELKETRNLCLVVLFIEC